jgi:signal transduction histidine kinase
MAIIKVYMINISILITFAYLINLSYKFVFNRLSKRGKYGLSVFIFIFAGWLTMFFSFEVGNTSRFDLGVVPLIFGLMVYTDPLMLFIIGMSIGLLRLTFGLDPAGWIGFINLTLLGIISSMICVWFKQRMTISYLSKAVIAVLAINGFNTIYNAIFGNIPINIYFSDIAPITFPTGVLLSFFFLIMIQDFQANQSRMEELSRTNRLLRIRTQDLSQAKIELENKAEQLEAASRYKSEFLANMSHELKTPLNSVLLLSQMQAEEDTQDEDRVRYANMIYQSGGELLNLVNDILDISKVEAGKLDIVVQPIVLDDVLRLMEEQFRPIAASQELAFETKLSGLSTEWIQTDPLRLNQILRNLLDNAFKFTEKGLIELEISTQSINEDQKEAIFQVRDTGVGIDSNKHESIFEVFKQEDGSISRKYGGSGLGLAISRQLAELLGGHLELHSEKGKGSCFTLTLPAQISTEKK